MYYADRLREVRANPSIVFCSPEKAAGVVAVKRESPGSLQGTAVMNSAGSVFTAITTTEVASELIATATKTEAVIKPTRKRKTIEPPNPTSITTTATVKVETSKVLLEPAKFTTTRRSQRINPL